MCARAAAPMRARSSGSSSSVRIRAGELGWVGGTRRDPQHQLVGHVEVRARGARRRWACPPASRARANRSPRRDAGTAGRRRRRPRRAIPRKSSSATSGASVTRSPRPRARRPRGRRRSPRSAARPAPRARIVEQRLTAASTASSRFASLRSPGATIRVLHASCFERRPELAAAHRRARRMSASDSTTGCGTTKTGVRHPNSCQVSLAELRMHHDPPRATRDVCTPRLAQRLVANDVGRAEIRPEPSGLARRHEPERIAERLQPTNEVVERKIVEHDERARARNAAR